MYQQNQYQPPVQMYPLQDMSQTNHQQYPQLQVKNGLQKLAQSQGIFIKQKFEALEAVTGYETPNVYKVYSADINGQKIGKKTIFKCKEKSDCFFRQCLSGDCRPFKMKVKNEQGKIDNGEFDSTLFLELERPFKCTFCCLARPEMSITFAENGQYKFFGKVKNPYVFCEIGCDVEDEMGNLKYVIRGSSCQAGYLCVCCPFQSCQEVIFEVKNPQGEIVTRLLKQYQGCTKACLGDADNFALGFPPGASPEEKALLMSATLFLDYMYFENKQTKVSTTNN